MIVFAQVMLEKKILNDASNFILFYNFSLFFFFGVKKKGNSHLFFQIASDIFDV